MTESNIPPRKYISEVALNLSSGTVMMMPPDQLHSGAEPTADQSALLAECHIYLIGRRPALSIDPATFKYDGVRAKGHLKYKIAGAERQVEFERPIEVEAGQTLTVDKYPHRQLIAADKDGKWTHYFPASLLAITSQILNTEIRAFEVAYVGQAYGDGSRSAFERLKSHSTLQRILADTAAKRPDDEVMLFLFAYPPGQLISHIDGVSRAEITGDQDTEHWVDIHANPPTEQMQVGLAEAGLIRYFQPEYNEIFKASFPNDRLKLLQQCYQLDFSALIVEIDTEDLRAPIYSSSVSRGVHHIAAFDLHDTSVRRSFFSIVDRSGRYGLMNDLSGPTF